MLLFTCMIPRFEKVISSKISVDDFRLLEQLARQYYLENKIKQPTISEVVRAIVRTWLMYFAQPKSPS
jgi:hypothetical protein